MAVGMDRASVQALRADVVVDALDMVAAAAVEAPLPSHPNTCRTYASRNAHSEGTCCGLKSSSPAWCATARASATIRFTRAHSNERRKSSLSR